jgi:methylase of polypeptide subunit release factors
MTDNQIPPFFFSFYESLPRQGPGDESISRAILDDLPDLPDNPDIIDMGCGTGSQTLILAERGTVTAVDLHPPFLTLLMDRAKSRGLEERIRPLAGSMDALPPDTGRQT